MDTRRYEQEIGEAVEYELAVSEAMGLMCEGIRTGEDSKRMHGVCSVLCRQTGTMARLIAEEHGLNEFSVLGRICDMVDERKAMGSLEATA